MKITNIKVEGFRSLKKINWSPGDLNVLIGPNASGKTNLLQFLELLNAGVRGKLTDFVRNQGGIAQLLWDGQAKGIQTQIEGTGDENISWRYAFELKQLGKTGSHLVEKEELYFADSIGLTRATGGATIYDGEMETSITVDEHIEKSELLFSRCQFPYVNDLRHRALWDKLSNWVFVYNALLVFSPQLHQSWVTGYEEKLFSDNLNRFPAILHTLYENNAGFREKIDNALQAAFNGQLKRLSFSPASTQRMELRLAWNGLNHTRSAMDASDGTMAFLALIAILSLPDPPSLIAIDEPETGLHPSMFPIIAAYAEEASRRTQVIISTHSPEMLSAFRGETKPTVTVAQWTDGQTCLQTLDPEHLDYWLKEYALGEMFRSGQLENMAQEDDE